MNVLAILSGILPLLIGQVANMAPAVEAILPYVVQVLPQLLQGAAVVTVPQFAVSFGGHRYEASIVFTKVS